MVPRKVLKGIGSLLAIFSVFWIIMGSTIMFHQVHIYHNHVDFWQVQAIHSNGKEIKKCFQFIDNDSSIDVYPFYSDQSFVNAYGLVALNLNERTIFSRYLYDLLTPEYIYDKVLRGPPIV